MINYIKEDIGISKREFFRLFVSYALTVFITIPLAINLHFRVIIQYNVPIWAACIAFLGFVCGCLLTGFLIDKKVTIRLFWVLYIILGIVLYFLSDILEIISIEIIIMLLFVFGFIVGSPWVPAGVLLGKFTKIEERGRVIGLVNLLGGILFLIITIITIYIELFYQFFIFGTLYLITGILNLVLNKDIKSKVPPHTIQIENKKRDFSLTCLITFAICFLWGFVILNVTWGAFNAFALQAGNSIFGSYSSFIGSDLLIFFISIDFIVASFFLGLISDKFGRKIIWIIGISAIIIAFFLFGLFQNPIFINILSITLGVSLPATLIGIFNFVSDITPSKNLGKSVGIFVGIGWGFGLAFGLIISLLFLTYPITNFALISVFIAIIGILSIIYTQETLPPKKERLWFETINHIYVISQGGIPLYNYSFKPHSRDAYLIAGGISGLCELIKELTMSESQLKVIKQEKANILIDYGEYITTALIASEELKILHRKLELFTNEFEEFFRDLLKEWVGDATPFLPTKVLIERIFEIKKFKPSLMKLS